MSHRHFPALLEPSILLLLLILFHFIHTQVSLSGLLLGFTKGGGERERELEITSIEVVREYSLLPTFGAVESGAEEYQLCKSGLILLVWELQSRGRIYRMFLLVLGRVF